MGYKGKNDREKVRIEIAARLIAYPNRKIPKRIVGENRCNDVSFRPLNGGIVKERCGGTLKLSFFQNVDITSVLEKTQP